MYTLPFLLKGYEKFRAVTVAKTHLLKTAVKLSNT